MKFAPSSRPDRDHLREDVGAVGGGDRQGDLGAGVLVDEAQERRDEVADGEAQEGPAEDHARGIGRDLGEKRVRQFQLFKTSYLDRFPLDLAHFWTSDHLSGRTQSMDAFLSDIASRTPTLKRR